MRRERVDGVYPRERGEAKALTVWQPWASGLSPRTRGSRQRDRGQRRGHGSIPANAGKPMRRARRWFSVRVYPRERGEAVRHASIGERARGLSPRTRGSQRVVVVAHPDRGSIPANAGKPLAAKQLFFQNEMSMSRGRTPYDLFTSNTPSASTIFLGGSPRAWICRCPTALVSRQTMTIDPVRSVAHHSERTRQTRCLTPAERSGPTYTPGATSSITDVRKPR